MPVEKPRSISAAMSQSTASQGSASSDSEYRAIEATLLETARGRWFLAEHGRRARRLDSALLEDAIDRLQSSIRQPPALLDQLQIEIEALRQSLADARQALLRKPSSGGAASDAAHSAAIIATAEAIHEVAWTLQANPFDPKGCEDIARKAGGLYALSQQQAQASSRLLDIASELDAIASRVDGILETVAHERITDEVDVA